LLLLTENQFKVLSFNENQNKVVLTTKQKEIPARTVIG